MDVRFALRSFKRSPVFTAAAVVTLALGIGANTAIFTLIDQLLLRTLPVQNPAELVQLESRGAHYGNNRGWRVLSYPMYQDFRDRGNVFNGVLCRYANAVSVSYAGGTERAFGEFVSGNYFQVLGVGAALGRVFTPEDDRVAGGHPFAVLSYDYWKTRFAGDPGILNKEIAVNGNKLTVIGVSRRGFDGVEPGTSPQVRVPFAMVTRLQRMPLGDDTKDRRTRWIHVFARLRPGISAVEAQSTLQPFYKQVLEMEVKEPAFNAASAYTKEQFLRSTIHVLPAAGGMSGLREFLRTPLLVLMALVGGVLLIACANIAGLLAARAAGRQKEIAVRLALGAGRARIVRQLLLESALLSVAGGVAGLAVAAWTTRLLIGFIPQGDAPLVIGTAPDLRVLGFTLGVSLLTALLFGLIPAYQATRPSLAPTLKDQAAAVTGGQVRFRKSLIAAQVGLSLLLLAGAGLFIRSLHNLRSLDPGFKTGNLIAFAIDPTLNNYDLARSKDFYQRLAARLPAVPGVRSASFASVPVLTGANWDSTVTVEGYEAKPGEPMNPNFNQVGPGYFATLGIPVLLGREFNANDTQMIDHDPKLPFKVPNVAIVNQKFARHYFGGRNPLGRRIGFGGDPGTRTDMEIIGVIADAKYMSLREEIPRQVFIPFLASPYVGEMTGYIRTAIQPELAFAAIRQAVRETDANLPVFAMRTLERRIDDSLATERLVATLSAGFGALAALLAAVGLYGVISYTVERRTREIGIRMAIGASRPQVVWLLMREVLVLVAAGTAVGIPAALVLARFVRSQLYGVEPHDAATLLAVSLGLAAVAVFSGYVPARRATRIDPIRSLRYD